MAFNMCGGIGRYGYEMDFVRVTKSNWAYEFEIKVTASDIRADIKNKPEKYQDLELGCEQSCRGLWTPGEDARTIDRLPNQIGDYYVYDGGFFGPELRARVAHPIKEFCVVVPDRKLADVAIEVLPSWVGVAVMGRFWDVLRRKAAKLKSARKVTVDEREHIMNRMTYRFWEMYFKHGDCGRR